MGVRVIKVGSPVRIEILKGPTNIVRGVELWRFHCTCNSLTLKGIFY